MGTHLRTHSHPHAHTQAYSYTSALSDTPAPAASGTAAGGLKSRKARDVMLLNQDASADLLKDEQHGDSAQGICILCGGYGAQSELTCCDHEACNGRFHLGCLMKAIADMEKRGAPSDLSSIVASAIATDAAASILCPLCAEFDIAAKELSERNILPASPGPARVRTRVSVDASIGADDWNKLHQILRGTAVGLTEQEQLEFLEAHILTRDQLQSCIYSQVLSMSDHEET